MHYLSIMNDDQTLVLYSGHPMGLFPSHNNAPRVVITNGMVFLVLWTCTIVLHFFIACFITFLIALLIFCFSFSLTVWFKVVPNYSSKFLYDKFFSLGVSMWVCTFHLNLSKSYCAIFVFRMWTFLFACLYILAQKCPLLNTNYDSWKSLTLLQVWSDDCWQLFLHRASRHCTRNHSK